VRVAEFPEQIVAELTLTVGVVFTVTVAVLTFEQFPVVPVTVYNVVAAGEGAIVEVRAPVLQVYVVAPDAVSVAGFPEQIVAELTETVGVVLTETVAVLALVHVPVVPITE
jgi:hypothetical protein